MIELLVIADDLTGANDTGAQFAGQGVTTLVVVDPDDAFKAIPEACEVLVVSTESRHLNAMDAAARVEKLTAQGRELGVQRFYKKTDSTLRGNIGAELEALLRASGRPLLAYAPAFPKLGRFTREGCQFIGERLVHETEFAADPLDPVAGSYIPDLIRKQSQLPIRVIPKDQRDQNFGNCESPCIAVFDAQSDEELERIGAVLRDQDNLGALAGSAGFASCLPRLLGLKRNLQPKERLIRGPMLVISGSLNEVSLRQAEAGEASGFVVVDASTDALINANAGGESDVKRILETLSRHREAGQDIILRTASGRENLESPRRPADRPGFQNPSLHRRVADGVAAIIRQALDQNRYDALVVFGGDTLAAVMRAMGWSALSPKREILPGVVLAETLGGAIDLTLVSKAGGFGPVDLLKKIKSQLRENS